MPAVVVEPRVGEEKLRELLAFGAEAPTLDYKEACDLAATRDRVELAKDVGAMQVDGGYILVGATSAGKAAGRLTSGEAAKFDEATLRNVLKKWIPVPFDILTSIHDIEGQQFALIYVAPSPEGVCIFRADGQYQDAATGKSTTVFREGDVFVRDGTQSRRWQQSDIVRFRARIRSSEKERWLAEVVPALQSIVAQGAMAQQLARGPATALTGDSTGRHLNRSLSSRCGPTISSRLV
jgi:hypothetical protein